MTVAQTGLNTYELSDVEFDLVRWAIQVASSTLVTQADEETIPKSTALDLLAALENVDESLVEQREEIFR